MISCTFPGYQLETNHFSYNNCVAANHENDTCFQIGLGMGIADCIFYVGLDKIP